MSATDDLLTANAAFAESFTQGNLPMAPGRKLAVLTCMDARIDPLAVLGLEIGEAHVIRNAGGVASDDAIRSLVISAFLLGTREFVVIQHTQCGMVTFTNEGLRQRLHDELGVDASTVDFLPFPDLDQSVRDDVAKIRQTPLFPPDILVRGFVYDVQSGRLREVT